MLRIIKEWFIALLKKIGEANNESLGNQRLDCCDLNQEKAGNKK